MKIIVTLFALVLVACNASEGQRCNPLEYSNSGTAGNCASGLQCIYPTAPNCGVAYCCAVDESGVITDTNPNCQPDPSLDSVCMLDLSIGPSDTGVAPRMDMTPED